MGNNVATLAHSSNDESSDGELLRTAISATSINADASSPSSSTGATKSFKNKQLSADKLLEAADALIAGLLSGRLASQQQATEESPILPHALLALERFLRLDCYEMALAFMNKKQMTLFQKCWKRGGKVSSDAEKKEKRTASLLPFVALEKLFRNAPHEQAQELRDRAFALGIVDVVLTCLSHIGRQEARYAKLRSDGNASSVPSLDALSSYFELTHKGNDNAKACYALKSHQDGKNEAGHGWNRGVGYGSGSTTSKWSIEESKVENAAMEEVVTCLIRVLAAFFNPVPLSKMDPSKANPLEFKPELMRLLYRSCFQRALHAFLLNDSVFEISKHVPLYDAVLEVEAAVASIDSVVEHPSILDDKFARRISEIDLMALMLREKDCGTEPLRQLEKLKRVIGEYLGHLVKEPAKKHAKSSDSSGVEDEGAEDEKQLDGLLKKCEKAMQLTKKKLEDYFEEETFDFDDVVEKDPEEAVKIKEENIPSDMLLVQVTPQYYCDAMKSVQFSSIPFFQSDSKTSLFPYHYVSSLPSSGSTADVKRMRRLAQEVTTLKTSLPLSDNSCVFVTTSEERMDVMKFLISGPTGTPYENGCFEFDVMFPPDYPNAPMKVNLATTGNGSVRFNPNLYNCGKVCLSLLGTWDGRPEESWSENSSFLQVLVSIQSLILVPDPYFNEPGYHGQRFSLEGKRASFDYNANIRVETVRWAMTDTLRNPPPAFENVIRRHFWLKSDEICEQVEQWIIELQEKGHENYLHRLKVAYDDLKKAFREMKPPEGFEKVQPIRFPKPKPKETNAAASAKA